jgi:hypothetical protein
MCRKINTFKIDAIVEKGVLHFDIADFSSATKPAVHRERRRGEEEKGSARLLRKGPYS